MSDFAKTGTTQLVNVVDNAAGSFITAATALEKAAGETAGQAVSIADRTAKAALIELDTLRHRFVTLAHEILDAITEPLP